ncbi:MAG: DedA family protein, partial [Gammaproteobacteria bacterium]|nr:DedA family protein [Gammaproteobacteria bacterium]
GLGAHKVVDRARGYQTDVRALNWLKRFGAKACLLSWLPVVGDPLCAVAGWLKLPFWPCLAYMAVGKFFRYLLMTSVLLHFMPGKMAV